MSEVTLNGSPLFEASGVTYASIRGLPVVVHRTVSAAPRVRKQRSGRVVESWDLARLREREAAGEFDNIDRNL